MALLQSFLPLATLVDQGMFLDLIFSDFVVEEHLLIVFRLRPRVNNILWIRLAVFEKEDKTIGIREILNVRDVFWKRLRRLLSTIRLNQCRAMCRGTWCLPR